MASSLQQPATFTPAPTDLPDRPWVAIVGNPFSGAGKNQRNVARLEAFLNRRGMASRVIWDRAEQARTLRDPRFERHCVCVVAAGGDGTVAGVINQTQAAPLAVLPVGTENLIAKYFGFTAGPEAVGEAILRGHRRTIDLGQVARPGSASGADGRLFGLMVSAGVDAEVVHRLAAWRASPGDGSLRRVRRASYVRPLLNTFLSYSYPRVTLEVDGRRHEGAMAMVFNIPRYALNLGFIPDADPADGRLDWVLFREGGAAASLGYLIAVARGEHLHRADVMHGSAERLTITATEKTPLQADGDAFEHTPVELSISPRRLQVVEASPR